MVERTDDQPGTGSATYCSAVNLRQASSIFALAQRSYANRATISSCMRITRGCEARLTLQHRWRLLAARCLRPGCALLTSGQWVRPGSIRQLPDLHGVVSLC